MASRIERCRVRSEGAEQFSEKEIRRQIRRIDRQRARYYGDTTGKNIKEMVPHIAAMLK